MDIYFLSHSSDTVPMKSDIFQFLIISLLLSGPARSFAEELKGPALDSIESLLKQIDSQNRKPKSTDCVTKCQLTTVNTSSPKTTPEAPVETITTKDSNNNDIQVSVVSEARAKELFQKLKLENLALRNYRVCAQRALIMGFTLVQLGIHSGKLFAKPGMFGSLVPNYDDNQNGHLQWDYHVAPFVYIRKNNVVIPMVLDPVTFTEPVAQNQWENFLKSNPHSSYSHTDIASQYIYVPSDSGEELKAYKPEELIRARQLLEEGRASKFFQR